jgi:formamidopyrimidine-DNA glycosylase
VERHGKYLVFDLDNGGHLAMHLKLSGSLWVKKSESEVPNYIKAVITLDDGEKIFFRDPRGFGRMWLVNDVCEITDKLGPEPLSPEFTLDVLAERLEGKSAPVKAVLLDQAVIAGIGNMYADEILYDAKIDPRRAASSLSKEEIGCIHKAIKKILPQAIASKGASVRDYFRPSGEEGMEQFNFKVAHQKKASCACGGPIERIVVRGRGTYWCPNCQK